MNPSERAAATATICTEVERLWPNVDWLVLRQIVNCALDHYGHTMDAADGPACSAKPWRLNYTPVFGGSTSAEVKTR